MCMADDRRHVMFAVRFEMDVAQDDYFVVALDFLKRPLEIRDGIFFVTGKPVLVRSCNACRGIDQAFAIRVFSRPEQERCNGFLGLTLGGSAFSRRFLFRWAHTVLQRNLQANRATYPGAAKAAVSGWIFCKILLVVVLGIEKLRRWQNFRGNRAMTRVAEFFLIRGQ